jgi:hypothetical protein
VKILYSIINESLTKLCAVPDTIFLDLLVIIFDWLKFIKYFFWNRGFTQCCHSFEAIITTYGHNTWDDWDIYSSFLASGNEIKEL